MVAARTPADVAATVAVGSERGERLTILGSGHGRLRELHGGVAISMRALADVEVDTGKRSARIGAGATWEPVLAATAPHGLAALCGSAPAVGVAGYLLGGGLGPLARTYGFGADHIQAVEVVTPADGSLTVTAESYPDLFWALRGGKGGLGVVTAVTIGLLPLTEVYGGALYFGTADVPAVLAAYAEWSPAPEAGEPLTCDNALTASRAVRGSRLALAPVPGSPRLPGRERGCLCQSRSTTASMQQITDAGPLAAYPADGLVEPVWRRRGIAAALTRARLRWVFARTEEVFYVTVADHIVSLHLHAVPSAEPGVDSGHFAAHSDLTQLRHLASGHLSS